MTEKLFGDIMIYYAAVNAAAFVMFALDKAKAKAHMWRIRERTLLLVSAIGGAGGAAAGMLLLRHKLRKPKFAVLVPVFLLAHLTAAVIMLLSVRYIKT